MRKLTLLLITLATICLTARSSNAQSTEAIVVESAIIRLIEQVEAPARAAGLLVKLNVSEGDLVNVGALLAEIDRKEIELVHQRAKIELEISQDRAESDIAVRSAQESLEFAQSDLERTEKALARLPGSISLSEIEEARFNVSQALLKSEQARHEMRQWQLEAKLKRNELELSQHQVELRNVTASVPGVVVEILRRQGEWVEPGDKVLRILRINRLRVEGLAPIGAIATDLKGAPVSVAVAMPGQADIECKGQITFISPEVNAVNGQVKIWAEIDNPDGKIRPGLRAAMTIHP